MFSGDQYKRYIGLREKFPVFVYESFACEAVTGGFELRFRFRVGPDVVFHPSLFFSLPGMSADKLAQPVIRSLAFHVGMVEMISYWKAFCSPLIRVEPHALDIHQQNWWKKLFRLGLAEFFHTNGIPQPGEEIFAFEFGKEAGPTAVPQEPDMEKTSAEDPDTEKTDPEKTDPEETEPQESVPISPGRRINAPGSPATPAKPPVMVPVGGGKDSVVTLETLIKAGFPVRALVINQRGATREVLKAAGLRREQIMEIDRRIDPMLLKLNEQGYLNGHTPFSAMLAFVSTLAARVTGDSFVVLSNESSASEATVPGTSINHQYSKSMEFESDFRQYAMRCFGGLPEYFSFLRPLNELQISALFSRMTAYHEGFRSCNAGSRTDSWCRECAKCLFTFIMLAPFIDETRMKEIFGGDLFAHRRLCGLLDQLTGVSEIKPFDCVGTVSEVNTALAFIVRRMVQQGRALPPLLLHYREGPAWNDESWSAFDTMLKERVEGHHLPPVFRELMDGL
jgi:UDP-N-acetyl-alpha-D-muramoyl-L-alanyl-L-glutamate epimerase